jgi:PPK2 family polyphosphate:nucleotide phosphotransferase
MSGKHILVEPGSKLRLDKISTNETGRFKDKEDAQPAIEKNLEQLRDLQEVLYADGRFALLVVLQAMDGGGKDGSIEHVFSGVNPQGCSVSAFKVPSHLEAAHDFLWRIHAACPAKGMIGIFNRSHYEDVLVTRVKKLVPKEVWSARYDQINAFEKMLVDSGTVILKFYLHISKDEQKQRMEDRLHDKNKNWKFSLADLETRSHWDDYTQAYQDALEKCSTARAPWYIVPADRKWFRNWVISDTIVRALKKLDLRYPKPIEDLDKVRIV